MVNLQSISSFPPGPGQIEISVFGPGVGECIAVHLGVGEWLVVDSCKGRGRSQPAALEYLESIGVDVRSNVKMVVATHWHDDHVKGIAQLFERAGSATFYAASAVSSAEFLALTGRRELASQFSSGVDELAKVGAITKSRSAVGGPALSSVNAARRLWQSSDHVITEVWALSPSDEDVAISREHIASLLPQNPAVTTRIPALEPNDTSVVLLLKTAAGSILLGGT